MSRKNPKLIFIQSVAQQERRLSQEISSEAKSSIKTLQQFPKPYYTIADVEDLVEKLKQKMQNINKTAHTEFSKIGLKGVDNIDLADIDTNVTLVSNEEFERLKVENQELTEKLGEVKALEAKIDDLQILLDEKETEIAQLHDQSGIASGKVTSQIEDLNRLQGALDEAQRDAKQALQDREKMETEFETVGNALMSARLEIEQLQQVLGNKDQEFETLISEKNIQLENLKSEVQILSSHSEENIKLKETVIVLQNEIDKLKDEHRVQLEENTRNNSQLAQQVKDMELETNQLKDQISKLEQENEDLLLDSGETSQEAVAIREKLNEKQQILDQKEEENRELMLKVERREKESEQLSEQLNNLKQEYKQVKQNFEMLTLEITTQKQELSEKTVEIEELQEKVDNSQDLAETALTSQRLLKTKVKDLETDLKGKNERIQGIESDRNELRESLANMKIEHEKQKSLITDLKTQLGTKSRELEEGQKDLELLRQRQEEITQQADDSRSKQAEIARERDKYEGTIKDLQAQLKDTKSEKERLDKKSKEIQAEMTEKDGEIQSLSKTIKQLENKSTNLMAAVETLRINLAKNPKYAILFVLQDIQQATLKELAKTVAIQNVFASRLLKELENEGWITFNETTGQVTLKKALLEID
ncbi:MAG: hypothetical protein JSW11_08155 [Candidatus Heimdallarchaeota archaeon]|nr:MAG: hypothetical protein JSW11_08155 [Candidatus Heimdallarchaeota archaeon]